jgi:hypothetical protein
MREQVSRAHHFGDELLRRQQVLELRETDAKCHRAETKERQRLLVDILDKHHRAHAASDAYFSS